MSLFSLGFDFFIAKVGKEPSGRGSKWYVVIILSVSSCVVVVLVVVCYGVVRCHDMVIDSVVWCDCSAVWRFVDVVTCV